MSRFWLSMVTLLFVASMLMRIAHAEPTSYILRFTDTPTSNSASGHAAPLVKANDWLKAQGWRQVWPLRFLGKGVPMFFAGPAEKRYLRLYADNRYYIWARKLTLDPQAMPYLELTWGMDRFPQQAALDLHHRNDRPLVVLISFGRKLPASLGFLPGVPRGLAFFWDETATIGRTYTCVTPRDRPAGKRMQCMYPHVKYVPLRRGGAGRVHTEAVNLVDHFRQQFPDYWQQHQRVPPIVGIGFEARSNQTNSVASARLYSIRFSAHNMAATQ